MNGNVCFFYDLGLQLLDLTFISIDYKNILLTDFVAEIWGCSNHNQKSLFCATGGYNII